MGVKFCVAIQAENQRGSTGKNEGSGGLVQPNEEMIHRNVE